MDSTSKGFQRTQLTSLLRRSKDVALISPPNPSSPLLAPHPPLIFSLERLLSLLTILSSVCGEWKSLLRHDLFVVFFLLTVMKLLSSDLHLANCVLSTNEQKLQKGHD